MMPRHREEISWCKGGQLKIFYYPFSSTVNPYVSIQKAHLAEVSDGVFSAEDLQALLSTNGRDSCVIYNWIESSFIKGGGKISVKKLIKTLAILFVGRVRCKTIVWVKHNSYPHSGGRVALYVCKLISKYLELTADKICVHSKRYAEEFGYSYIPHPLYKEQFDDPTNAQYNKELKFIFIGRIMPYKGMEALLGVWPAGKDLTLAGACSDAAYATRIRAIIDARGLKVKLLDRHISDEELDQRLSNADVFLLPHTQESAIVSGGYYLAKSYGCVILSKVDYESVERMGSFIYTDDSLDNAITEAAAFCKNHSRLEIINEIHHKNSYSVVSDNWKSIVSA